MNIFADAGLGEELLNAVADLGFVEPTPIQDQAIPHILNTDRDLIAFAQTGTGKTAAFGLPCLQRIEVSNRSTQLLVLCPTRELCIQIARDLESYAKYLRKLQVTPVYGGSSIDTQIRALKRGAQVVVGTPGRTLDLIKRRKLKLDEVTHVVLDEADEMLTMGFKDDLEAILESTPRDRQTLLFSATMSKEMKSVTKRYMDNPERISVAADNKAAETVSHVYYMVHARDRYDALKRIADINPQIYGIIFCRTRRDTKEVANKLAHDGYNADAIHGDLSQSQRDEVMGKFRSRQLSLLVATDVAARGLDVNDLTHVINYNLPDDIQSYVHRSGRTGRAGKNGISIAIIHSREGRKIRDIERSAGIRFNRESVPTGQEVCQKQLYAMIDKVENIEVDEKQIGPYLPEIIKKLQWLERDQLIKHFVSVEFNRFLSYYKGARDLNIKDKPRESKQAGGRRKPYTNFYINLGTKNNLSPAKLIGLVNEHLQSDKARIGKIEVFDKNSFFEVEDGWELAILTSMNGQQFGSKQIQVQVVESRPSGRRTDKRQDKPFGGKRGKKGPKGARPKGKGGRRKNRR